MRRFHANFHRCQFCPLGDAIQKYCFYTIGLASSKYLYYAAIADSIFADFVYVVFK